MKKNMQTVQVTQNHVLEIIEDNIPLPKSGEVLIKVAFSGLCGSDIPRVFHHGAHFYPITLGHEFSGKVVDIGDNVVNTKVGDRVTCAPLIPCFDCKNCKSGLYSLCKSYSFVGSRVQGANAEYVSVPENCICVLPNEVSLKQGAFFEPLTVGLHPMLLAGGCQGKKVIIIGVGTIGLLAVQSALAMGAASVCAIDIDDSKLEKAKLLGANQTLNSLSKEAVSEFAETQKGVSNQLILETAGTPITVKMAIEISGPRAQIGLVGTLHDDISMTHQEFAQILRKEVTLFGSWMNYSKEFPGKEWILAAEFFTKKLINIELLVQSSLQAAPYIKEVLSLNGKPPKGKILLDWTK